jgi:hypothetical protein
MVLPNFATCELANPMSETFPGGLNVQHRHRLLNALPKLDNKLSINLRCEGGESCSRRKISFEPCRSAFASRVSFGGTRDPPPQARALLEAPVMPIGIALFSSYDMAKRVLD